MNHREFEEFGTKIQDIIDQAVNSQNYQKLNQSINQTVNKAIEKGGEAFKNAINNTIPENMVQKKQSPVSLEHLYRKPTGVQFQGILLTIGGGLLSLVSFLAWMTLIIQTAWGIPLSIPGIVFVAVLTAATAGCLSSGISRLGFAGRFKKYRKALGMHTYCNLDQLTRITGKSIKFIRKDVKKMIQKGCFTEGYLDIQETCLITSKETYYQYLETQRQLEMKKKELDPKVDTEGALSPEVQEILDKGNAFLVKIRKSNDAIPGYEISAKISRMEMLVQKIFERAKEHPEVIPDLKKLMNYYLPVTVKLLDAYEDMDSQPIQGENIQASKKEIEDTIDTLNIAFEKLLDSIFKDIVWDVSSDISVLNTILAQEGLTEDSISARKKA